MTYNTILFDGYGTLFDKAFDALFDTCQTIVDDLQLDKLMNGEKLEPPSKNGRNQAHGEEPEAEEKAVEEPSAAADQGDVVITDEPEPEETKEPSDD